MYEHKLGQVLEHCWQHYFPKTICCVKTCYQSFYSHQILEFFIGILFRMTTFTVIRAWRFVLRFFVIRAAAFFATLVGNILSGELICQINILDFISPPHFWDNICSDESCITVPEVFI